MREKQKAARIYGVLERQFRRYYEEANRRPGKTGDNLLIILEPPGQRRVPRWPGQSRDAARQTVRHGHILVNGKKVDIPSYRVKPKDIVEVRPDARTLTPFLVAQAEAEEHTSPAWMEVILAQMRVLIHQLPVRDQIDTLVTEQLIVELYSK